MLKIMIDLKIYILRGGRNVRYHDIFRSKLSERQQK